MTTFEIILIVILIYLIIAHIINFICIADNCLISDFRDLICNLLWIISLPAAIIRAIKEKMLDK